MPHITFNLKKAKCPSVSLNGSPIPQSAVVKYHGIHSDQRLTWAAHIINKNIDILNKKLEDFNIFKYKIINRYKIRKLSIRWPKAWSAFTIAKEIYEK